MKESDRKNDEFNIQVTTYGDELLPEEITITEMIYRNDEKFKHRKMKYTRTEEIELRPLDILS